MEIFVARQPILTKEENIIGYELFYRNSMQNSFTEINGDVATTELLLNSFLGIGNEKLSKGKKLFINFTRNLLVKRVPCLFPPEKIIIEILEDVKGDEEIITVIKEFKQLGYTIALDDFLLNEDNINLFPYADIIKVDFLNTTRKQRNTITNIAKLYNCRLLAEKVETRVDYENAIKEGFLYFQGYFFSKPKIFSSTDIPFQTSEYFRILHELSHPEPDIERIASVIETDLSLSYKILKIINTAAYYTRVKITSIKQAIVILGLNELIKWLTIISLKEQQPLSCIGEELLSQALIRAKFAEQLGSVLFGTYRRSECFMLGMFSLLDTLLKIPMKNVLESIPISDCLKNGLLKKDSELTIILEIIEAIEKVDWETLNSYTAIVSPPDLTAYYVEALKWSWEITNDLKEY